MADIILVDEDVDEAGGYPPAFSNSRQIDYQYLKKAGTGLWRTKALCLGRHDLLSLFFAENATRARTRAMMIAEAKEKYCDNCPVRRECFHFAKDNEIKHGVWGGIDFTVGRDYTPDIPDDID